MTHAPYCVWFMPLQPQASYFPILSSHLINEHIHCAKLRKKTEKELIANNPTKGSQTVVILCMDSLFILVMLCALAYAF